MQFLESVNNACVTGDNNALVELLSTLLVDVRHLMMFEPYPLFTAINNGHAQIVRTLVQFGVDIDSSDTSGKRAIHHAIIVGFKNVLDMVLSYRPDVNAVDDNGNTPLHYYILYNLNDDDLLYALLDREANVFAMNHQGKTPLALAVELGVTAATVILQQKISEYV